MKIENMTLIVVLVVVIGGMAFAVPKFIGEQSDTTENAKPDGWGEADKRSATSSKFEAVASGSTNAGDVSIVLTPQEIIDEVLRVDISVNTHSVDLSPFDLTKITGLEYGGKVFAPVSAPSLGGHHSSGTLKFNVDENVDAFIIKIRGIPNVEERVFKWN